MGEFVLGLPVGSLRKSEVLIGLGSNLGDRLAYLKQAALELEKVGDVVARSRIYETAPLGGVATHAFLNSVICLSVDLSPLELLGQLLRIEEQAGRLRERRWDNRTLDLDILLWRDSASKTSVQSQTSQLQIPHPLLLQRGFALLPAAEVAGNWVHPISGLTLAEHAAHMYVSQR